QAVPAPRHSRGPRMHDTNLPTEAQTPPSLTTWLDTALIQRYDRLYDARPFATLPLGQVLAAIVHGRFAAQVRQVRALLRRGDLEGLRRAKNRLPAFTFAGVFQPTRSKAHLTHHSGIVHVDLDHVPDLVRVKLHLQSDPCVVYAFQSPSGTGLK